VTGSPKLVGTADTILLNGFVYTMEPEQPDVEAVAIGGGKT